MQENSKVEIRLKSPYGFSLWRRVSRSQEYGVFAIEKILKNEVIAAFDGIVFDDSHPAKTRYEFDHMIQFGPRSWRSSKGLAVLLNHSCDPNCGIRNLFEVVAMRNILPGEELTWDYEMTENYRWTMKCRCGSSVCRKIIGRYSNMPQSVRRKYQGYISSWLAEDDMKGLSNE